MRWSSLLLFVRAHHHRLEEEAERILPGPLDDYRKRRRGEEHVRSQALHTPGYTKMSLQLPADLTDEEQANARACQTLDREEQVHILSYPGERKKPSTHKTVFQKILLLKETTVYE